MWSSTSEYRISILSSEEVSDAPLHGTSAILAQNSCYERPWRYHECPKSKVKQSCHFLFKEEPVKYWLWCQIRSNLLRNLPFSAIWDIHRWSLCIFLLSDEYQSQWDSEIRSQTPLCNIYTITSNIIPLLNLLISSLSNLINQQLTTLQKVP